MERIPALVIGAGVVGCAVAREFSARGVSPWILEQGPRIAEGVTSRNSGVIHAGLYYPPGSLKAESCIEGQALLYEWCDQNRVPFRRTGKWVVAQAGEESFLEQLLKNAEACGAKRLERISGAHLEDRIAGIRGSEAIWSPNTGIVDVHALTRSYLHAATDAGAEFVPQTRVTGVTSDADGYRIETTRGEIWTERVVNCAGLESDRIAELAGAGCYKLYPWRGDYFAIRRELGISSLVYPVKRPGDPGLGIHLTIDLAGALRLGPDAYIVDSRDDFADPVQLKAKLDQFYAAAARYLPDIRPEDLHYSTCGIRPKLRAPGDSREQDFVLREDLPRWVNLIGIESPGLTASLSLARRTARLLLQKS